MAVIENQDIVRDLIRLIQQQGLETGDRLPSIRQLAAQLDCRPHLVRDAMLRAQTLGLVRIHPRSGAFVQALNYGPLVDALSETLETSLLQSDHHLFHLLEARKLIELELTVQAAKQRRVQDLLPVREALVAMSSTPTPTERPRYVEEDIRFHLAIARIGGNPVLLATLKALLNLLRPYLCQLPFDDGRRAQTQRSHEEMYQALVEGDPDAVRARLEAHLSFAYDNLLRELQSLPAAE